MRKLWLEKLPWTPADDKMSRSHDVNKARVNGRLEKEIMGLGHLPSESDMPAEIELHKVGNRPNQYAENSRYEMDLSSKP